MKKKETEKVHSFLLLLIMLTVGSAWSIQKLLDSRQTKKQNNVQPTTTDPLPKQQQQN